MPGAGLRISVALGFEDGVRCLDAENEELHVVQQLRYSPCDYGGFYLSEPKSGSSGTVDLDPMVADALRQHVKEFPLVEIEMPDITGGPLVRRTVPLLFTTPTAIRLRTGRGRQSGSNGGARPAGLRITAASTRCGTSSLRRYLRTLRTLRRSSEHYAMQRFRSPWRPTSTSGRAANGVVESSARFFASPFGTMPSLADVGPDVVPTILALRSPWSKGGYVEPRGLEPLTPALQRRCSAS